jgi:hypothetical protein
MDLQLRHIGYVVEDLDASLADFRRILGSSINSVMIFPDDDLITDTRFAFIEAAGATFELIQPVTDRFREILLSSGRGINHICFTVSDIDAALKTYQRRGVQPGHVTPDGILEMPHQYMVYLDPLHTGGFLIELIQPRVVG